LLSEEQVGKRVRDAQRAELAEDAQTKAILQERGMVG
jgi:hypothetical protein